MLTGLLTPSLLPVASVESRVLVIPVDSCTTLRAFWRNPFFLTASAWHLWCHN